MDNCSVCQAAGEDGVHFVRTIDFGVGIHQLGDTGSSIDACLGRRSCMLKEGEHQRATEKLNNAVVIVATGKWISTILVNRIQTGLTGGL